MTVALIVVVVVLALALAGLSTAHLSYRKSRSTRLLPAGARRILFPYVADALSQHVLDAALRLAAAEDATLVPVFLARVSLHLPLDTPLPRQCAVAVPLQEAIEQRAGSYGVPVDGRIERGRNYRHALRRTVEHEHFDRIVVAAATHGGAGFNPDDVRWLLASAPGEIVILRPDQEERLGMPAAPPQRRIREVAHV